MAQENVYRWSFIERVTLAVLNFGGNILLARMLSAGDFGLLAMVAIFVSLAYNLSSCGLSDGLIHKPKPTPEDYSTVFVFNSAIGLCLGVMGIALAHPVARFFGHEELVWIMRMYGICFFFQTMSFVQETRLRKQLQMKKLCIARIAASVTSLALGLILAALGCGYWALVSTQIFLSFFMFVYIVAAARWFPKLAFSRTSFKEFFGFGVHLMMAYMLNTVSQNVNTFLLGRYYTSAQTGLYYQGAKLANVPFSLVDIINAPFFVVASNEEDADRRRVKILDMFKVIVTLNVAIALLLVLIALPVVVFVYGAKWQGSAPVLTVMALTCCLMCIKFFCQTIFKVHGRTRLIRDLTVFEIIVQLTMLFAFYHHGLTVVALTQFGANVVSLAIYLFMVFRMMQFTPREVVGVLLRPMLFPLIAFVVGLGVKIAIGHPGAFLECVSVALAYGAVMLIGHLRRKRSIAAQN